jgi:hypothetical protein
MTTVTAESPNPLSVCDLPLCAWAWVISLGSPCGVFPPFVLQCAYPFSYPLHSFGCLLQLKAQPVSLLALSHSL